MRENDAISRSNAISRSAALSMMDEYIDMAQDDEMHHAMCVVAEGLAELPAIDAVPVVRCKDCRWYDSAFCVCSKCGVCVNFDFYCADGEKEI